MAEILGMDLDQEGQVQAPLEPAAGQPRAHGIVRHDQLERLLPVEFRGQANPVPGKGQFAHGTGRVKRGFATGRCRAGAAPRLIKDIAQTDPAFGPAIHGLNMRIPDRPAGHFKVENPEHMPPEPPCPVLISCARMIG